jgi:hypothetical protein
MEDIRLTAAGATKAVIEFLTNGGDVNAVDAVGATALMAAASSGDTEIVKALIANGADVHAVTDDYRFSALWFATTYGHTEAVQALIVNGADVNAVNNHGSILMLAAGMGHTAIIEVLIAGGAELNAVNADGDSALMFAVRAGHIATVETLIANGASTTVVNKKEESALNLVTGNDTDSLINLLRGGLEALQGTCRLRDQEILNTIMGNVHFDLIKLIISFDCDLAFEHFPQYSLNRLKASIPPQMLSVNSGNSLITNTPFIATPFEEETKGRQECVMHALGKVDANAALQLVMAESVRAFNGLSNPVPYPLESVQRVLTLSSNGSSVASSSVASSSPPLASTTSISSFSVEQGDAVPEIETVEQSTAQKR